MQQLYLFCLMFSSCLICQGSGFIRFNVNIDHLCWGSGVCRLKFTINESVELFFGLMKKGLKELLLKESRWFVSDNYFF